MSSATALSWFARHEIRLAWREWLAMMTGSRGRRKRAIIALIVFAAVMHLPAYAVVGRFADLELPLGKPELIVITATIFLAWALMLSQAIESVTRVFYARADLELIMSSPVRLTNIFSVRIAAIALSARHVKGLLQERVRAGCTVIMTTHILEVAERMADRIGVIAQGKLVAEGTLAELRQQNGRTDTSLEDMFIALVDTEAAAA